MKADEGRGVAGALAPSVKRRSLRVLKGLPVPSAHEEPAAAAAPAAPATGCEVETDRARPHRISRARLFQTIDATGHRPSLEHCGEVAPAHRSAGKDA